MRNNDGQTALDLATEMEEPEVVDYLEAIAAGAAAPGDSDTSADTKTFATPAQPEADPVAEAVQPELNSQPQIDGDSFEGVLDLFTGKDKGRVVWACPFEMFRNGVFKGLYKSTVDKAAREINGIIIATIFHAYLLIGYYLLAVFFDCDESQAFSKNPYKETSINVLAKRDDIPFTRQRLTDCIKAAAVDMELRVPLLSVRSHAARLSSWSRISGQLESSMP